mmetsp:Transcript_13602/g.20399  ORF Transcript_13602/g.20399 Transcript_13602/m.20399 type:complete len:343 (+) Transcript_13602:153-1181(+)
MPTISYISVIWSVICCIYVTGALDIRCVRQTATLKDPGDTRDDGFEAWVSSSNIVYIQFGKVGSTAIRHFLWNTTNFHLALSGNKLYKSVGTIYNMHTRKQDLIRNSYQGGFGVCEEYLNSTCLYFTTLRHPLSRVISSYNYFCRSCAEEERFCRHRPVGAPPCPNVSLVEWASYEGNVYVNDFSLRDVCRVAGLQESYKDYFASRSRYVTVKEFLGDKFQPDDTKANMGWLIEVAIANALNRRVVMLPTGVVDFIALRNVLRLQSTRIIPHRYSTNSARSANKLREISPNLKSQLVSVLYPDIIFYKFMETRWNSIYTCDIDSCEFAYALYFEHTYMENPR